MLVIQPPTWLTARRVLALTAFASVGLFIARGEFSLTLVVALGAAGSLWRRSAYPCPSDTPAQGPC
jgi:hypothetical protein